MAAVLGDTFGSNFAGSQLQFLQLRAQLKFHEPTLLPWPADVSFEQRGLHILFDGFGVAERTERGNHGAHLRVDSAGQAR